MKKIIASLILIASMTSCSCSKCNDRDSDCVCKPDCKIVEEHCGCREACGCKI